MSKKIKFIAIMLIAVVMTLIAVSCGDTETSHSFDLNKDREGNEIILPETIDKIMSVGASNTEILTALGMGDKIIAIDPYSENISGIKSDIPMFDMYAPDAEQILVLNPDIILVAGMAKSDGIDSFGIFHDMGICVIYIPSSTNIDGIKEDIRYIAAVVGAVSKGEEIVTAMEKDIADIKAIGDTITEKKTVYFEISAAPWMYSFGRGVFLNEMIEMIGAVNVLGEREDWISVADEAILDANPDVILTSVNYLDDPVGEIKSRDGWNVITAVQNSDVYYIDTDASNRPSQNIVKALKEMAKAVYPDKY